MGTPDSAELEPHHRVYISSIPWTLLSYCGFTPRQGIQSKYSKPHRQDDMTEIGIKTAFDDLKYKLYIGACP